MADATESIWTCAESGPTRFLYCHTNKQRTAPWSVDHSGFDIAAARYACWPPLFLATTSDPMCSKVTGRRISHYTFTRLCLQSSRLLLQLTGGITQSCYWQVSANLNAATWVITNTRKYDRGLHHTMRHELHWLDMSERIQFRIATTVYRCLHGRAPEYLSELCIGLPVNQRSWRYRLRSSQSNQIVVPPVKLSTYGPRSFAVAGPTTWNSLPEYLRDPELSIDTFRRQLD